jgi:hypothetical protein
MKLGKTLAIIAISSLMATGAAFAGGTPNDAAGAKGHDAPSSASPTPGVIAGRPDAMVSGRSASMHHRMMKHRMMKHRMMHKM